MRTRGVVSCSVAALGLLLSGCGSSAVHLDRLAGTRVGTMAERQLEVMHPAMAPGSLTCPTLDFRVGAEVRCFRTADLSGGREVRMLGTVRVTSLRNGGELHIRMDDDVTEFGVSAEQLQRDLAAAVARRTRRTPTKVTCPYLRGAVGRSVQCSLRFGTLPPVAAVATVTGTDPTSYRTTYRFTVPSLRQGSRG